MSRRLQNFATWAGESIRLRPKSLIFLAAFVLLLALDGRAWAADLKASWTPPTQNVDGSAIPATGAGALTGYRLEYGSCTAAGAFDVAAGSIAVTSPTVTTATVPNVGPGTHCLRVYAKNTYGVESFASSTVSKTIDPPKPRAPVLGTVELVAYDVRFDWRSMQYALRREVGTVPIGTPCFEDFAVGEFYRVPRDAVTLTRNAKSPIIVAKCAAS